MAAIGVRRDKAALSSGCKPHPATAPAGSNRSATLLGAVPCPLAARAQPVIGFLHVV